jgi:hypothetical protein
MPLVASSGVTVNLYRESASATFVKEFGVMTPPTTVSSFAKTPCIASPKSSSYGMGDWFV